MGYIQELNSDIFGEHQPLFNYIYEVLYKKKVTIQQI